jgi:uncharacterized protein with ParB-like and HNH nuclease domain
MCVREGSILLIKGDDSHSEIIDGQQRLTTLTMLLSAIRSLIKSEFAEGLTGFLCEKGGSGSHEHGSSFQVVAMEKEAQTNIMHHQRF